MAGITVAAVLIASLVLVHFSMHGRPMANGRPLDVDEGLPLPEVGQASTVFSLTALFGAYLGIYLLLGLPAVLGLAVGTAGGLWVIRSWIDAGHDPSFDAFLYTFLSGDRVNRGALALSLSAVQLLFATSELLILRSVVSSSLGVHGEHGTLLVVALGVIAYFYVLFGGYLAVFRTDVLQFLLVAAMGAAVLASGAGPASKSGWAAHLLGKPGYWELGTGSGSIGLYAWHFFVACVMGVGFLLASPDAWKRVFLVTLPGKRARWRFAALSVAAVAPFLLLVPIGRMVGVLPDGPLSPGALWNGVVANNTLFVVTALGLFASFLSAFNGALIASVHVGLVLRRHESPLQLELPRFHWLMVAALLCVFFVFSTMRTLTNPYLLANLLLGPYAVIGGVLAGTRGRIARAAPATIAWLVALGVAAWFAYFNQTLGMPLVPTTYEVNTVPAGALLFLLCAGAAAIASIGGSKRVHP